MGHPGQQVGQTQDLHGPWHIHDTHQILSQRNLVVLILIIVLNVTALVQFGRCLVQMIVDLIIVVDRFALSNDLIEFDNR